MMFASNDSPQFQAGDRVVSLVIHSPEIQNGTRAVIISPHAGMLYAVELPNGELHQWIAWFELQHLVPFPNDHRNFEYGETARVVENLGHHMIQKGMIVRIVKAISTPFYDIRLQNGEYHRWLAEFEITRPLR